jgi:ferric-dicitrate binding protein FerR (iron transport regulator)
MDSFRRRYTIINSVRKEFEGLSDDKKTDDFFLQYWFTGAKVPVKPRVSRRMFKKIKKEASLAGKKQNYQWISPLNNMNWFSRIAAILFIPLLIGSVVMMLSMHDPKAPSLTNTVYYSSGEAGRIELSDGTVIWLNACSSLEYPSFFTKNHREVTLTGEAYFQVVHRKNCAFIVHTEHADIKVLGTSFNASAYADEDVVVSLDEGSVSFVAHNATSSKEISLSPGEQIVYDPEQYSYYLEQKDTKNASLWRSGILSFEDQSLELMVSQLERKFGTDIDVRNEELLTIRYSGTFENESLETILGVLSEVTPMKYQKTETGYMIKQD